MIRRGNGVIDRIYDHIRIFKFRWSNETIEPFDYKMLMFNKNRAYSEKEEEIVRTFRERSASMQFNYGESSYKDDNRAWWEVKRLIEDMDALGRRQDICDILILGLFCKHKTPHKAAFWMCYGDVVYDNLVANLKERSVEKEAEPSKLVWKECSECGDEFRAREFDIETACPVCRSMQTGGLIRRCIDCGAKIPPRTGRGQPPIRCEDCQKVYRRAYKAGKERLRRARLAG